MKVIGIILLFLFSPFIEVGDPALPLNAAGKVTFEEFVEVEELGKEALFINAMNFAARVKRANENNTRVKASPAQLKVSNRGSFYVYTNGLFTPQIHGEIIYRLDIEVTDEGYNYSFSDFVFQYYKKNRYGRYAPVSGKKKALEEEQFAGMQDVWQEHKETTRRHVESQIRNLKKKMKEVPPGARLNTEEHSNGMHNP